MCHSALPQKKAVYQPESKRLMQRTDCKEFVSLVSCDTWDLQMRIATTTQDLADLSWSPDGSCFVVWDIILTYKLLIYSSNGHCLASYSAYQDALGIRTVQWSPDGQLLAIGSYDQVRKLSCSGCAKVSWPTTIKSSASIVKQSHCVRCTIVEPAHLIGAAHPGSRFLAPYCQAGA